LVESTKQIVEPNLTAQAANGEQQQAAQ